MSREEAEALGLLGKEHFTEVSVTETNLAVFGYRAGDTEGLETDTDSGSGVGSLNAALFDGDSGTYSVSPNSVFKADRLCSSYNLVAVDTGGKSDFFTFFDRLDSVLGKYAVNLVYSSFVTFK